MTSLLQARFTSQQSCADLSGGGAFYIHGQEQNFKLGSPMPPYDESQAGKQKAWVAVPEQNTSTCIQIPAFSARIQRGRRLPGNRARNKMQQNRAYQHAAGSVNTDLALQLWCGGQPARPCSASHHLAMLRRVCTRLRAPGVLSGSAGTAGLPVKRPSRQRPPRAMADGRPGPQESFGRSPAARMASSAS